MTKPVIPAKGAPASRSLAPRLRRVSAALLIALGTGSAALLPLAPLPALARGTPDSFADLAAQVSDAVVNISVSQAVADRRSGPGIGPNIPRGTPFDDLFEEFFRRRGQGQGQGQDDSQQRPQRRSNSLGSGFVIDPSGIIVTNNHVVGDATDVTVIFTDGTRLKAEILGKDSKSDVAVLRVKPEKPLKAVKFGDSNKTRVGDWVMAVGNPFGLGGTVTVGILSARNRNINSGPYDDYLQTDASINRGNSGGPLFNVDGEVIGVNTAILSPSGGSVGIGFASPSNILAPLVEQLQKFGETRRGWLGVKIQSVDDDVADSLGLGKARGALVAGVDDKGPAKPAGIKAGDVIVKFDGTEVKTSADLPRIVAGTAVGKDVDVLIVRGGKEQTLKVKLGRLEDGERQAALNPGRNDTVPEPRTTTQKALGMEFSNLNDANRTKFSIKEGIKGVVVTNVDPNSPAADKRIQAGDTIVEINQEAVNLPTDIATKMKAAKEQGRKSALFLVANSQGEVRFVALPVE
ncbi:MULTISPECIES: Do family serine endopeptidase [unclassified Beijerinckia]|uniref:Do family serine endopeptidase n=1 Tax=unclassified Beijerinckia TaxID=2638183 RepID=UPI000898664D|nr:MULTISPECIES: Do family serine endopeptidase [unclassified Beijerinckia]MDH7799625.1 serine protease Do [Beijerinckia sp. GAS462]SEB48086.1 serine protease Do [Beijerinckia sp. 28-YEA-48]